MFLADDSSELTFQKETCGCEQQLILNTKTRQGEAGSFEGTLPRFFLRPIEMLYRMLLPI